MFKTNKGITLVSLITTIALMLILTGATTTVSYKRFEINKYNKLDNDLELLYNKVSKYYVENKEMPILKNGEINIIYISTNCGNCYIIDLEKINGLALNYGKDYKTIKQNLSNEISESNENSNIYLITDNFKIYYAKGVKYNNTTYYELGNENLTTDNIPPTKPKINIISGEIAEETAEYKQYITEVELEIIEGKDGWTGTVQTTYSYSLTNEGETSTGNFVPVKNKYTFSEIGIYEITVITTNDKGQASQNNLKFEIIDDIT